MSQTGAEPGTPWADDRLASVLRPVRAGNGFEEALEQIMQVVRLGLVPGGERLPHGTRVGRAARDQPGDAARGAEGAAGPGSDRGPARPLRRDVRTAARRHPGRGRAAPPPEGHRRRGHPALSRGAGGGRGGIVRGTRPDQRRGRETACGPGPYAQRAAHGVPPPGHPPAPHHRRAVRLPVARSTSTRPSAPGSTTSSTASRCWCGTWSTPSSSTRPWWRPFSTRTPRPRGRSCGSTAPVRRPCCAASSGEPAHSNEHPE